MPTASNNNANTGEPSKLAGQFHSVKGTLIETLGAAAGAPTWTQAGKQEHAAGEAEYRAAAALAYVEGAAERLAGRKDAIVGAITGDRAQEAAGNLKQDRGEAKQKLNAL